MRVGKHNIEITHGDKYLFPDITKRTFVDYYVRIAPTMLRYMQQRPVTMHRFPQGISEDGFYHKDIPDYFPEWMETKEVSKKEGGTTTYVICNDAATLVYLANYDCITPHIWLSTVEHLQKPDRLIFDLDPSEEDIPELKRTAWRIKEVLTACNLTPFIMTTGSRGFHIFVPIKPEENFDPARHFAEEVADYLAKKHADTLTTAFRKAQREGRIFIDTNRIAYAQTGVAPYSVRAKPETPIATPIRWDELDDKDMVPQKYTIKNMFYRLGQIEDPWKDIKRHAASLPRARAIFEHTFKNST